MKKYIAEFIGTFILVFFGTGIAVVSGGNLIATAFAFGLAIIASAYVIGSISGCHVNPAVSLAMYLDKRLDLKDFTYYVVSQVLGALAGTLALKFILEETIMGAKTLGANGFLELSAVNISMCGAFVVEVILTCVFVYAILGVTKDESKSSVAPIVIGLTLTFVHLLGIGLTGTSVNPARSLAPALVQGGEALNQVWLFVAAPLVGGFLAACLFKYLNEGVKTKKK